MKILGIFCFDVLNVKKVNLNVSKNNGTKKIFLRRRRTRKSSFKGESVDIALDKNVFHVHMYLCIQIKNTSFVPDFFLGRKRWCDTDCMSYMSRAGIIDSLNMIGTDWIRAGIIDIFWIWLVLIEPGPDLCSKLM